MSFAEIADRRLLSSVTAHLGELTWDVDADGYQRLRVPPTADVDTILRLLLRRGLEPALVTMLLDRFESRPIERALIAWDIAAGSLLGKEDAALAQRVRSHLSPLKQIGTSPTVAVPRDRVAGLIKSATAIGDRAMPEGSTPLPSLASIAALDANHTVGIDAALALAERLSLAHLPSLALAYAQILWTRHALPAALDRMIEIVLDHERFDSLPPLPVPDAQSMPRQTYFAVRVALAQLDTETAADILAKVRSHPAAASLSSHPALEIATVELDLHRDQPVGQAAIDRIEAIAPNLGTWRYASRVVAEVRMQLATDSTPTWVEGFLSSFGNDLRVWAQAGYHAEVRDQLLALSSREIRYQPWDPDAWRSFMAFLDDATPVEIELQQRSAAQLAAALA
ncbi:MAG: hypothetical protein H0T46_12445 [Deltaproteobacteria bacterium]|nr:hypothetical protein [Deltaproteobacteria bacterium]